MTGNAIICSLHGLALAGCAIFLLISGHVGIGAAFLFVSAFGFMPVLIEMLGI